MFYCFLFYFLLFSNVFYCFLFYFLLFSNVFYCFLFYFLLFSNVFYCFLFYFLLFSNVLFSILFPIVFKCVRLFSILFPIVLSLRISYLPNLSLALAFLSRYVVIQLILLCAGLSFITEAFFLVQHPFGTPSLMNAFRQIAVTHSI